MTWRHKWEMADPMLVLERKQARAANTKQSKQERAKKGLTDLFGGVDMGQPIRAEVITEPLFQSAHAALVFAFNFNMQQYDRPLINKLAGGSLPGGGRGLSGIDGAAQAGMIRAELERLNPVRKAMVVASVAPREIYAGRSMSPGKEMRPNPEWKEAVMIVSWDMAAAALSGCISHRALRAGIVARCFGVKVSLVELAERCGVAQNTATNHYQRIRNYLHGTRGGASAAPVIGEVRRALDEIEARLIAAGMVAYE